MNWILLFNRQALSLIVMGGAVLVLLTACDEKAPPMWSGYAEGEYLYLAASRSGRLQVLPVQRGDEVTTGTLLFALDPEPEAESVAEARARLAQAEHRLADLGLGQRPSELAAIDARLTRARAERQLAMEELARAEKLLVDAYVSREEVDRVRTALKGATAAVAELEAQRITARLGGRSEASRALAAEVVAAEKLLAQAEWTLAQKRVPAPQTGQIFDTLYRPGEFVSAGSPVVILLPPDRIRARFFVPESDIARLRPGTRVRLIRDGATELTATVTYLSPQAEYNPPVIYSRESRNKLVYRVEAAPDPAQQPALRPGQPLNVTPVNGT